MPKRKTSVRKTESTHRVHRDEQINDLIAALTRLAVVHEQAEKRREKADQRIDKVLGDVLPALLAQMGIKPKPNLRPVS